MYTEMCATKAHENSNLFDSGLVRHNFLVCFLQFVNAGLERLIRRCGPAIGITRNDDVVHRNG